MASVNGSIVTAENWPAFAGKTIVNSGLVGFVIWIGSENFLKPAMEDQREFVKAIKQTNERYADSSAKTAETLNGILRVQEQIRDDQRRGVWNQAKSP